MRTLVTDPFEDDAKSILEWGYGKQAGWQFRERMTMGERAGQAFMNVLLGYDRDAYVKLTGTTDDPFYNDHKLLQAIDRLTSK
jgi:hypothetical protein